MKKKIILLLMFLSTLTILKNTRSIRDKMPNPNERELRRSIEKWLAAERAKEKQNEANLLRWLKEPNMRDEKGNTPLHLVDTIKQTKALLKVEDIDVNAKNNAGDTPLISAIRKKKSDIVQALLETKGIKINEKDSKGDTPLIISINVGNEASIILAILKSPNIYPNAEIQALLAALNKNNKEIANILLKDDIKNINEQDKDGNTALILATQKNDINIIKKLLNQKGINPDIRNKEGDTALHWAVANVNIEAIKALKNVGANVNIKNNDLRTPIQITTEMTHTLEKLISICNQVLNPIILNIAIESGFKKNKRLQANINKFSLLLKPVIRENRVDYLRCLFGRETTLAEYEKGPYGKYRLYTGLKIHQERSPKSLTEARKDRKKCAQEYKKYLESKLKKPKELLDILNN